MTEKRGDLVQEINNLTGGKLADFLLAHNLCPECGSSITMKDMEKVCTSCGLVVGQQFSNAIPFGKENVPGNQLCLGNGMGDTLQMKGTFLVLAKSTSEMYKCPKCGYQCNDLPIRARQTMILTSKHEHPKIATLLKLGSQRAKDFNFDERASKKGIVFSNYYGKMLRKVGGFIVLSNERVNLSRIVDVCLAYCLRDLVSERAFEEAKAKLALDERLVHDFGLVYEVIPK